MSTEAYSADSFVREYTRELHNNNAAVFIGAGMSVQSGYVDWKGLLKNVIVDLKLDPDKEHDLVSIAQYHCNAAGGNKTALTQTIFDYFSKTKQPTPNHRILASLPILTYWTTNYDKLIEKALEEAKKVADVKYGHKQLPVTKPDRDVVVYKMHGDIEHPADAIITRDDYEAYFLNMGPFLSALRGDLVEKTFLFVGFSFTDPNIDFILSRVRVQYEQHQRQHYCIQRRVSRLANEDSAEFEYRQRKQEYFIRDLKRFGIYTVLVDEYSDVSELLARVAAAYKGRSILFSGAAEQYGRWQRDEGLRFVHDLSYKLLEAKNRVISGFGVGVGGAVVNGALAYLDEEGKTISDQDLVLRPFPQEATGSLDLAAQWTRYRKAMISHAGIALFLFGNKKGRDGDIELSNGVREEFELCIEAGVRPLPVGATGTMARELWALVQQDFTKFYPQATAAFKEEFTQLGDETKTASELISLILKLVGHLQRA